MVNSNVLLQYSILRLQNIVMDNSIITVDGGMV